MKKKDGTYLVVVRNDLVAKLLGAAAAPLPNARYVRLVLALCNPVSWFEAGGGSLAVAVDMICVYSTDSIYKQIQ